MFTNIKLSNNKKGRIIDFYNEFSVTAEKILLNLDQEQQKKFKKRKLSLPDNILMFNSLESDSAFNENLRMYEAFTKSLFSNHNKSINKNQFKIGSLSAMTSPLLIRSVNASASGMHYTPRTNRVKNYFAEFEKMQPIVINMDDASFKDRNEFRNKLLEKMPSGIKSSN